jgi:pantoate--beta-alanine ligase
MQIFTTRGEFTTYPHTTQRAVVMTMGALHAGHAALLDEARALVGDDGQVVATIFVNPLQFGAHEDFDSYPRTLEHDFGICRNHDVDVVFAPSVEEIYGSGQEFITVDPGWLGEVLEGRMRPGHFRGMLTVVAKLLNITQADIALFGEKDYQQLVCITRMVEVLRLPVHIVGVPTVRDPDGLAMSSRNVYLSADERERARLIPAALKAAQARLSDGVQAAEAAAAAVLAEDPDIEVDYCQVRGLDLGEPAPGDVRIVIAARIGATRLIDNVAGFLT